MSKKETHKVINGDCCIEIPKISKSVDLTFLDPPFNQDKDYENHNDLMNEDEYWSWMLDVCKMVFDKTTDGGAIYFMQREKNTHFIMETLEKAGWTFQNLIIWKKKTSAIPGKYRLSKSYQSIVFSTKGKRPRVFNRLRIDPTLLVTEKYKRKNGISLTDVWNDIRELTSGYFAGNEPFRTEDGQRFHKQQSPNAILLRIILLSSKVGDTILDPFGGTGTTPLVSLKTKRNSITIEKGKKNTTLIKKRLKSVRVEDDVEKYREDYYYTENLDTIFPKLSNPITKKSNKQLDILK